MPPTPRAVRAELLGGDPYGRADRFALSWWLPEGAASQAAYRIVTTDGHDTGRVESGRQVYVDLPWLDAPRRSTSARSRSGPSGA